MRQPLYRDSSWRIAFNELGAGLGSQFLNELSQLCALKLSHTQ